MSIGEFLAPYLRDGVLEIMLVVGTLAAIVGVIVLWRYIRLAVFVYRVSTSGDR